MLEVEKEPPEREANFHFTYSSLLEGQQDTQCNEKLERSCENGMKTEASHSQMNYVTHDVLSQQKAVHS